MTATVQTSTHVLDMEIPHLFSTVNGQRESSNHLVRVTYAYHVCSEPLCHLEGPAIDILDAELVSSDGEAPEDPFMLAEEWLAEDAPYAAACRHAEWQLAARQQFAA